MKEIVIYLVIAAMVFAIALGTGSEESEVEQFEHEEKAQAGNQNLQPNN